MPEANKKRVQKKTNQKPLSGADIKAAAAVIPGLIARQAGLPSSKSADRVLNMALPSAPYRKKVMLWGGIGTLTLVVLFMWVWNLKSIFTSGALRQSPESLMLHQAKTDLGNIFSGAKAAPITSIPANPPPANQSGSSDDADTEAKIQEGMQLILATSALQSPTSTSSTEP